MYTIINTQYNEQYILRESDNALIPSNEENTDYQAYLTWVAEGNEAEEVEQ
jgi:hypothetical protein